MKTKRKIADAMPSTDGLLSDRVCLVTGAGRGIGAGIARELGVAGATVYVTGRTEGDLGGRKKELG